MSDDGRVALVRVCLVVVAAATVVLFGWLYFFLPLIFVVSVPFSVEARFAPIAIASQAMALVLAYAVIAAASREKALVVYLRRFGRSDANAVVEAALRKKLGARYRVVTLDDGKFVPLHLLARSRLLIGAPSALGCAFLSFVGFIGLMALRNFTPTVTGAVWFGMLMATAFLMPMAFGVLALTLALSIVAIVHAVRLRRRRTLVVRSPEDLDAAAAVLGRLKSWWRRPSLADVHSLTIKTADEIWQATVRRFLTMADLILFDISERTSNLEWELARVDETCPDRVVFITAGGETEGSDAVSYADASRRSRAAFRRSLSTRLDAVLGGVGRRSAVTESGKRARPAVLLLYLAILVASDSAAILAWPVVVRWVQSHG